MSLVGVYLEKEYLRVFVSLWAEFGLIKAVGYVKAKLTMWVETEESGLYAGYLGCSAEILGSMPKSNNVICWVIRSENERGQTWLYTLSTRLCLLVKRFKVLVHVSLGNCRGRANLHVQTCDWHEAQAFHILSWPCKGMLCLYAMPQEGGFREVYPAFVFTDIGDFERSRWCSEYNI